jgi:hypothetical protein
MNFSSPRYSAREGYPVTPSLNRLINGKAIEEVNGSHGVDFELFRDVGDVGHLGEKVEGAAENTHDIAFI